MEVKFKLSICSFRLSWNRIYSIPTVIDCQSGSLLSFSLSRIHPDDGFHSFSSSRLTAGPLPSLNSRIFHGRVIPKIRYSCSRRVSAIGPPSAPEKSAAAVINLGADTFLLITFPSRRLPRKIPHGNPGFARFKRPSNYDPVFLRACYRRLYTGAPNTARRTSLN